MALNALLSCFSICFKELNKPSEPQQSQTQQYQQQQQAYPGQYQSQPQQQQQQAYPPIQAPHVGHTQGQGQGQSWSQVAGSSPHGGQGHGRPHGGQGLGPGQGQHQGGGAAADYYNAPGAGTGINTGVAHVPGSSPPQSNGNWQSQAQHGYGGGQGGVPAGGVMGPYHPGQQNQDQVNATNQQYTDLRNRARRAGDEAHKCFASSQQAYQSGDGEAAHQLSMEGKKHAAEQDRLDDEAAEWIFRANNQSSPPGTIDLHGLYVKEAIERTESAIAESQRSGMEELRVIVGKGIHSQGGVGKIKPAVQDLMRKYNLSAHIDPQNTGVLIVDLQGRETGSRSRDAGGLVDEMDKDQGCVIM